MGSYSVADSEAQNDDARPTRLKSDRFSLISFLRSSYRDMGKDQKVPAVKDAQSRPSSSKDRIQS